MYSTTAQLNFILTIPTSIIAMTCDKSGKKHLCAKWQPFPVSQLYCYKIKSIILHKMC